MKKLALFLGVTATLLLAACGGGSQQLVAEGPSGASGGGTGLGSSGRLPMATMPTAAPQALPLLEAPHAPAGLPSSDLQGPGGFLETAGRKVISTAFTSLEVEVVQDALSGVRAIAEGLGGFVERLSSSGDLERQQASVTVRVPQQSFFTALERIKALGRVQSESVGSEDVSERFIDLEAHLKSSLREEQSLLSLLGKAQSVGEILSIERELSRVRSEIERLQGQLSFLEQRVELATITVSLFPTKEEAAQPPSASLTLAVSDVAGSLEEAKALVSSLEGTVDRVFLSEQDGVHSAEMSVRVVAADFEGALAFLERQGKIQSKEVREGNAPSEGSERPEKPDARIDLSLVEKPQASKAGLIAAIVGPVGGVALAGLLGVLFYLTYGAGRRRDRQG